MGNKWKKILLSILSLSMTLGISQMMPVKAVDEKGYEIYPNPQSIEYLDGEFVISKDVNVVYDETIDDVTKNRVKEIFDSKNINITISNKSQENVTNVLIGTYGSQGYVDQYFDENIDYNESFFDKIDSHILYINNKTIAILGKNTDASFYGVTSLKHIFNQMEGRTIRHLRIDDFASTKTRGFIEGYYGIPWSDEDRISLMEFGGDFKMTSYIFAPKDDPYHSGRWRDLYPAERLAEMRKMVEVGQKSKCRFVWTIHPFMNGGITASSFDSDIEKIIAKFEQLYDIGVRQFGVLGDDAGGLPRSVVVDVMDRLQKWVDSKGDVYNLVFCPGGYNNAWWVQGELDDYDQGFDKDIQIFWTGEAVCQPVEQITLDHFKTRDLPAGASPRRSPLFWLNWPVNDINMKRLMMGKGSLLHTDVNVEDLEGVVTNPMQEAEASKVALFAVADYAWNVKGFDADKSWQDSFKYIDENAGDALYEMAKHLSDPSPNGHGLNLAESEELKPLLDDFKNAFAKDEDITDKGQTLINEFEKIMKACDDFDQLSQNENLKEEIDPWRLSLKEISEACIELIQTAIALKENQNDEAVSHYTLAVAKIEASKSHIRQKINNQTDIAQAGAKYIIPFADYLNEELSITIGSIIDPSQIIAKVITNRSDTPTGSLENLLDNDETTDVVWKNPNSTTAGTYIGIMYNQVIDINSVTFKMGQSNNARDTFDAAKVQYTVDGKEWIDIANSEYSDTRALIELEGLGLKVKGVRIISTQDKGNMWLGCKDIIINGVEEEPNVILSGVPFIEDMVVVAGSQDNDNNPDLSSLVDGSLSSGLNFREGNPDNKIDQIHKDAAVGLEFDSPQYVGVMKFYQASGDKVSHAAIEYRVNGVWKQLTELSDLGAEVIVDFKGVQAEAVRLRNLDDNTQKWWNVFEILVEEYNGALTLSPLYNTDNMVIRAGSIENIIDGSTTTNASFAKSAQNIEDKDCTLADAWVGVEFGEVIEVGLVNISHGTGAKDKIAKAAIEYRVNGEWKIYQTLNDVPYEIEMNLSGVHADAVRIRNLEKTQGWWQFNELSVQRYDSSADKTPLTKTIIKTSTFGIYSGSEANLLDGSDSSGIWYSTSGDITREGDYLGLDLGRIADLGKFHAAVGLDGGDKWEKYDLQYSIDGENWTTFKSYTGVSSGQDIIDEDMSGIQARYVRLVNKAQKGCWIKFGEIDVSENTLLPTQEYTYTNVDSLKGLESIHSLEQTTLLQASGLTLQPGEYVGIKLERLKDLSSLEVDVPQGLVLEISENGIVFEEVTDQNQVGNARYVRLINKGQQAVSFDLTKFIVNSNEIYELNVSETNRFTVQEKENLFDKNRASETIFKGSQVAGAYVTYDLGQVIDLHTFKVVSRDSNTDFPRHAKISVSQNGIDWTDIMTFGNQDGTANPGELENTDTVQDILPVHEISYNTKSVNDLDVKARYIKFEITQTKVGADKWVRFTEFEINDGEPLASTTDPTVTSTVLGQVGYEVLKVVDKDTSSAFKPVENQGGELVYKVTEDTQRNKITVLQSPTAISKATVYAEVIDETSDAPHWIEVGTLNTTLNEFVLPESVEHILSVKIEWNENQDISIQELLVSKVTYVSIDKTHLNEVIRQAENADTASWTKDSQEALKTALQYAKETRDNEYVSMSIVDSALSKLVNALNHPELKGDLSDVQALLTKLKAINNEENLYVKSTFNKLQTAIQSVENIIEDADNVSEDDVVLLMSILQNAEKQLIFSVIPKENLVSLIESIQYEMSLFDEDIYHEDSLNHLKDILNDSQDLVDASASTAQYIEQYKLLTEAYDLNEYAKDLKLSIEKYDVIVPDAFEKESYQNFADQLLAAKELLNAVSSSQDVLKALETLDQAYQDLTLDIDHILPQVEQFEKDILSHKSNYTVSSITPFEEAVNAVKDMMNDLSSDKIEQQKLVKDMFACYDDLVNIKILNAELEAFEKTESDRFMSKTYAEYKKVYDSLDKESLRNDATQEDVDQFVKDLQTARQGLVHKASQKDIQGLVTQLQVIDSKNYTVESYSQISSLLKTIDVKAEVSQEDFIQMENDVIEAISGLVDITQLNERLDQERDASLYTEETYQVLADLLIQAEKLKINGTEEDILIMVGMIDEAIKGLKEKPVIVDPIEPEEPVAPVEPIDPTPEEPVAPGNPVQPTRPVNPVVEPTPQRPVVEEENEGIETLPVEEETPVEEDTNIEENETPQAGTQKALGPNMMLIGGGIVVVLGLLWILFAKRKKEQED
jgi:beta-N-acetylglucosaminidase./F5/8 type C domain.